MFRRIILSDSLEQTPVKLGSPPIICVEPCKEGTSFLFTPTDAAPPDMEGLGSQHRPTSVRNTPVYFQYGLGHQICLAHFDFIFNQTKVHLAMGGHPCVLVVI